MIKPNFSSILTSDSIPETNKNITPHTAPLYLTSSFIYESADKAAKVFRGEEEAFIYSRWSHPNAELVEYKIAAMEAQGVKGIDSVEEVRCLLFSSGMAAVSALFLSQLKPGDGVLAQGNIYGTSVDFLNTLQAQQGIEVFFEDFSDLDSLEKKLKKHTNIKLLYAETPSNPTLNCYDLKALSTVAHKHKAKLAVDNTFASPYLQQPFKLGVDFILYSTTKYLNGHGTSIGGAMVGRDAAFMNSVVWNHRKLHGSICAPFDAWLLNLGMKTLPLRMDKHCANAMDVAVYLSKHTKVSKVHYLGLPNHPQHSLAAKQMADFGGVLSFELKGGMKAAKRLMDKIKHCKLTASLGTTDTLIQHPASMSHLFVPKKQREQYGITDGLIRLAVGIENAADIIADLEQGLK